MRHAFSITPLVIWLGIAPISADEVKLEDGSSITGEVLGLDAGGELRIAVPIAPEPLSIRAGQVRKVTLSHEAEESIERDATLTLTNGDRLPCDIVGIDDENVRVVTDTAGELSVKRDWVSSLQLGIRPRRVLYQGPAGLEDWKVDEGWHFEDDALASEGRGSVSRSFESLPASFSLSFLLTWAQRPNFQIYFCSEHDEAGGGKHDRYYLQFNAAGFEIKRQSSGESTYHTLGSVQRKPNGFNDPRVAIELRVDRENKIIQLYLDGKLEGSFPDPLATSPEGNGMIFTSNLKAGEGHRVSRIIVREWDSVGDRHQSEDRGEGDGDALIDHEGQRFSGELIDTRQTADGSSVFFKSPHFPKALEIPLSKVSTIFLSRPTDVDSSSELILGVAGGGFLSANDCRFVDDKVELDHPMLGALKIDRSSVRTMVKREPSEDEGDEETTPNEDEQ